MKIWNEGDRVAPTAGSGKGLRGTVIATNNTIAGDALVLFDHGHGAWFLGTELRDPDVPVRHRYKTWKERNNRVINRQQREGGQQQAH